MSHVSSSKDYDFTLGTKYILTIHVSCFLKQRLRFHTWHQICVNTSCVMFLLVVLCQAWLNAPCLDNISGFYSYFNVWVSAHPPP